MSEITKVTSKGQVVIPSQIRKALNLKEGSALAVSSAGDMVLMRKMDVPDLRKEFEELTKSGEKLAKKRGIKNEEDVVEQIRKWRRAKSRA